MIVRASAELKFLRPSPPATSRSAWRSHHKIRAIRPFPSKQDNGCRIIPLRRLQDWFLSSLTLFFCSSCFTFFRLSLFLLTFQSSTSCTLAHEKNPSLSIDAMAPRNYDEAMVHNIEHSPEYYQQMEDDLNVLEFTQRVYGRGSENLLTLVKNFWYQ